MRGRNRAVAGLLRVQRNGTATVEEVDDPEPAPRKNPDAEELLDPHLWEGPVTTPGGGMSYPALPPTLNHDQRSQRRTPAGAARRRRGRHAPASHPLHRCRARPCATEHEAATQWNASDLAARHTAVGVAHARHATWSALLTALQGDVPAITRLLLDPAVPGRLGTLESACDAFDRDHTNQTATPTVAGFHAAVATHGRVQTALADPVLTTAFSPAGPLATTGQAFHALPAGVRTAVEGSGPPVLRILTRLPASTSPRSQPCHPRWSNAST